MPFGIQPIHLIVVGIVALVIFGPRRLPQVGRWIGRTFTEFRKGTHELSEGIRDEISKAGVSEAVAPSVVRADASAAAPTQTVPPQPANANGKYCSACGAANPEDARYCNKCGTQVHA
jgi:sec-independent protein translocase protein TatA